MKNIIGRNQDSIVEEMETEEREKRERNEKK